MQNGTWFTHVDSCLQSHLVWCTPTIYSHWLAVLQMKHQGVFLLENMSWQHIVDSIHFFISWLNNLSVLKRTGKPVFISHLQLRWLHTTPLRSAINTGLRMIWMVALSTVLLMLSRCTKYLSTSGTNEAPRKSCLNVYYLMQLVIEWTDCQAWESLQEKCLLMWVTIFPDLSVWWWTCTWWNMILQSCQIKVTISHVFSAYFSRLVGKQRQFKRWNIWHLFLFLASYYKMGTILPPPHCLSVACI